MSLSSGQHDLQRVSQNVCGASPKYPMTYLRLRILKFLQLIEILIKKNKKWKSCQNSTSSQIFIKQHKISLNSWDRDQGLQEKRVV